MCDVEEADYAEYLLYREAARAKTRVAAPRVEGLASEVAEPVAPAAAEA